MLPCASERSGFDEPPAGEYPIVSRTKLPSIYDPSRTVYLYNTQPCDLSIILTDAPDPDSGALRPDSAAQRAAGR